MRRISLLDCVHILANLGEDIWVSRRREDPVEVGLVEALSSSQDLASGVRRGERYFVWRDAYNWTLDLSANMQGTPSWVLTISLVDFDMIHLGVSSPGAPYFPCATP